MVRRTAIADVGPLDEEYFLHCEDLDWCMRFHQRDWSILFVPDARVVHEKGISSRTQPITTEWYKHKGMIRYYKKFFRSRYPAALFGLTVVGVWMRFVIVAVGRIFMRRGRG